MSSKFQGLTKNFDNNFKTVKDNSNLKQTWTRGIVSLHLWQISLWTFWEQRWDPFAKLGERKSVFYLTTCSLITQKLSNIFTQNFIFSSSRDPLLTFLLSHDVWVTSNIRVNFRFERLQMILSYKCLKFSHYPIHVFEVRESIAISTELPWLGDLENSGRLPPVQHVLGGTGECALYIFEISWLSCFCEVRESNVTFLQSYLVRVALKI